MAVQKKNATVAIIGAGDFIGGEIAKKFASEGFTVFVGRRQGEKLAPLVRPGGLVVLDDYTPDTADNDDHSRRIWLDNPMYRSQEIMVTPHDSVILAVRTG